jgi:exodeoxyribonuclease III
MKLTTWNCARGFAGKADLLFSSSPDIAVVQECSKKSEKMFVGDGYDGHWVGENPNIGMCIFHKRHWGFRQLAESDKTSLKWVVPFEVTGPETFTLIAVWACEVKGNRRESYVGQIHRALNEFPHWFERGPIVVAGDFNSNAIFDKNRRLLNHSSMVNELKNHGAISTYHELRKEKHGEEKLHTFHLHKNLKKPFHFDYIFAPESWRERMKIEAGNHADWLSHSDHFPLTLETST